MGSASPTSGTGASSPERKKDGGSLERCLRLVMIRNSGSGFAESQSAAPPRKEKAKTSQERMGGTPFVCTSSSFL